MSVQHVPATAAPHVIVEALEADGVVILENLLEAHVLPSFNA
jgi:hypothetical protein